MEKNTLEHPTIFSTRKLYNCTSICKNKNPGNADTVPFLLSEGQNTCTDRGCYKYIIIYLNYMINLI